MKYWHKDAEWIWRPSQNTRLRAGVPYIIFLSRCRNSEQSGWLGQRMKVTRQNSISSGQAARNGANVKSWCTTSQAFRSLPFSSNIFTLHLVTPALTYAGIGWQKRGTGTYKQKQIPYVLSHFTNDGRRSVHHLSICNGKGKFVPVLFNWSPIHEGTLGNGGTAPVILWPRH
jgi:hypothetical protein